MIIKWNQIRIKVIENRETGIKIILQPGNNQVDNAKWKVLRNEVLDQIKSKDIEEVNVVVKKEEKKGPGGKVVGTIENVSETASFQDMEADGAERVVAETFNLETLKEWKKKEGRESVRAVIMKQIELVMEHGQKKSAEKSKKVNKD